MSQSKAEPLALPRPATRVAGRSAHRAHTGRTVAGVSFVAVYLSLIVLIPLAAVVVRSQADGWAGFWAQITTPEALAALRLTIVASVIVALLNVFFGTLIAWVLVRDEFRGKRVLDTFIDLPFALPTIVAGLVLLSLYGAQSPVGINMAYSRIGVGVALLFVTLPFVVRTVQPVLIELDAEMEQAAHSLGASRFTTFRRIILPNLLPAIMAGTGLAFARAISEFGSTVLISGNIPFQTQVSAVHIFSQIETDNTTGAAAEATVLLVIALVVILALDGVQRWGLRRG